MGFLPPEDRAYLDSKGIAFEEKEEDSQKGVILRGYLLPSGRFDVAQADILILLPSGYPDVAPDMFYLLPWVKLVPENKFPNKAHKKFEFNGQNWQRWSRHNSEWRPGVDSIKTMIKRVENALKIAS